MNLKLFVVLVALAGVAYAAVESAETTTDGVANLEGSKTNETQTRQKRFLLHKLLMKKAFLMGSILGYEAAALMGKKQYNGLNFGFSNGHEGGVGFNDQPVVWNKPEPRPASFSPVTQNLQSHGPQQTPACLQCQPVPAAAPVVQSISPVEASKWQPAEETKPLEQFKPSAVDRVPVTVQPDVAVDTGSSEVTIEAAQEPQQVGFRSANSVNAADDDDIEFIKSELLEDQKIESEVPEVVEQLVESWDEYPAKPSHGPQTPQSPEPPAPTAAVSTTVETTLPPIPSAAPLTSSSTPCPSPLPVPCSPPCVQNRPPCKKYVQPCQLFFPGCQPGCLNKCPVGCHPV